MNIKGARTYCTGPPVPAKVLSCTCARSGRGCETRRNLVREPKYRNGVCLSVAASAISSEISFALILLSERLERIAVCGRGPSAVAGVAGCFGVDLSSGV
jgi:hypothetical protein